MTEHGRPQQTNESFSYVIQSNSSSEELRRIVSRFLARHPEAVINLFGDVDVGLFIPKNRRRPGVWRNFHDTL